MFDLVIGHQRELKKLPPQELQNEIAIMQLRLADKLYFKTGIESDELDVATDRLKLEEDEQYKEMVEAFTVEVQKIQLGQPQWEMRNRRKWFGMVFGVLDGNCGWI